MPHSRKRKSSSSIVLAFLLTLVSAAGVLLIPRPGTAVIPAQFAAYSSAYAINDPVFSPDGTQLAFSSNISGTFQLWSIGLDGRHLTRLTYLPGDALSPEYSPRGRYIAFYYEAGTSGALLLMNSDGTNLRQISDGASAIPGFEWSPDGSSIAYQEVAGTQHQITVKVIGESAVTLRLNGTSPAWSDDGRSLAFVQQVDGRSVLSVANMTDGRIRSVCTVPGTISHPQFSSNSSTIVFANYVNGTWRIEAARTSDGSVQDLLQPPVGGTMSQDWTPILGEESLPAPRPHDKVVVFGAESVRDQADLFRIVPNTQVVVFAGAFDVLYPGTALERLTLHSYKAVGSASWSLDGNWIAFIATETTGRHDLMVLAYTPPKLPSRYGA